MAHIKDTFLRRLAHNYSRYILLTVSGSVTFLLSFSWTAETSLLSAAGLAAFLELLISSRKSKRCLDNDDASYVPQSMALELQRNDD